MLAYAHETGEALGGELRPGNAGANTAADQIAVAEHAIAQIPAEHVEGIELLLRADTAGATHKLLAWAREHRIRYSVGYELTDAVRAAILATPDANWRATVAQDGAERPNGEVCEITAGLDLTTWPTGSRMLVRRERPHPGAQLTLHRPRRLPLPSHPHRPDRPRHRRARTPPPRPRPRRRPHPQRQRHRPAQPALPRLRTQPRLAATRPARPRPDRLDPTAAADRRTRALRTQTAALPAAAHRRAARVPRPHRDAAPPSLLALGRRTGRRIRPPQSTARTGRLTPGRPAPRRPAAPPGARATRTAARTRPPDQPAERPRIPPTARDGPNRPHTTTEFPPHPRGGRRRSSHPPAL